MFYFTCDRSLKVASDSARLKLIEGNCTCRRNSQRRIRHHQPTNVLATAVVKERLKVRIAGSQTSRLTVTDVTYHGDHTKFLPPDTSECAPLAPASKPVLDLPTSEYPAIQRPEIELATSRSQVRRPNHYTTEL